MYICMYVCSSGDGGGGGGGGVSVTDGNVMAAGLTCGAK